MKQQRKSALSTLKDHLLDIVDKKMGHYGFQRKSSGLEYSRSFNNLKQSIYISPRRPVHKDDNTALYITSSIVIQMNSVNQVISSMNLELRSLQWEQTATIWSNIGFLCPYHKFKEWRIVESSGFSYFCDDFWSICESHTIPFCNSYCNAEDILNGFLLHDKRLPVGRGWIVRVIAACLVEDRKNMAKELYMQHLNKPGLRKEYGSIAAILG